MSETKQSPELHITLVQPDIVWEDKKANLSHIETLIKKEEHAGHVVVLPEMFSTGFSMAPAKLAETMDGPTVQWMADTAVKNRCIVTGSIIIEEEGLYYNRMLWVQPDGHIGYYDKRHLFAFAGEHKHYAAGSTRTIAQVGGWKINLIVCYDLRFPVWSRNKDADYDVLICVANWPQQRSLAWKALLQARAIENMCYVAGVNRVGKDANGNKYNGDSSLYGPLGECIWQHAGSEAVQSFSLHKDLLDLTRSTYPFLNDADKFVIL